MRLRKNSCMIIVSLVLIAIIPVTVFSQQTISGPQSGILGPGTYEVVGNITIESGKTLSIKPGTDFEHSGNYAWSISGELQAVGTKQDKIRFLPKGSIEWGGIQFLEGCSDNTVLDYCVIEKCVRPWGQDGGGINIKGASITIQNSTITQCSATYGGGINASDCSPVIRTALFTIIKPVKEVVQLTLMIVTMLLLPIAPSMITAVALVDGVVEARCAWQQ